MNNKMMFRILGALASALIIVSVFVPFVSVVGYSTSLWNSYENALYLPIIIIVFGLLGVILFALNKKTEFAYMTTGATLFFIAITAIDAINNNTFSTYSIGFYFLAIGSVMTGLMAFLNNLKSKDETYSNYNSGVSEQPMVNQMNNLYRNEQVIPVEPIQPIPEVQPVQEVQPIPDIQLNTVEPAQPIPDVQPQPIPEINNSIPVNPVIQDFNEPQVNNNINPVVNDFMEPQVSNVQNPVVQDFNNVQSVNTVNPVVNDFMSSQTNSNINQPVEEFTNTMNTQTTDIFGQPINK